ncbi:MAG: hypothetical protein IJH38_01705 [Clostridia bacterium]|nr:hypothetical protein [Clostridia bacterium]
MIKSIAIKSLINGIAGGFVYALILTLTKGVPFVPTLTSSDTILAAVTTVAGCFIGLKFRERRQREA